MQTPVEAASEVPNHAPSSSFIRELHSHLVIGFGFSGQTGAVIDGKSETPCCIKQDDGFCQVIEALTV